MESRTVRIRSTFDYIKVENEFERYDVKHVLYPLVNSHMLISDGMKLKILFGHTIQNIPIQEETVTDLKLRLNKLLARCEEIANSLRVGSLLKQFWQLTYVAISTEYDWRPINPFNFSLRKELQDLMRYEMNLRSELFEIFQEVILEAMVEIDIRSDFQQPLIKWTAKKGFGNDVVEWVEALYQTGQFEYTSQKAQKMFQQYVSRVFNLGKLDWSEAIGRINQREGNKYPFVIKLAELVEDLKGRPKRKE